MRFGWVGDFCLGRDQQDPEISISEDAAAGILALNDGYILGLDGLDGLDYVCQTQAVHGMIRLLFPHHTSTLFQAASKHSKASCSAGKLKSYTW